MALYCKNKKLLLIIFSTTKISLLLYYLLTSSIAKENNMSHVEKIQLLLKTQLKITSQATIEKIHAGFSSDGIYKVTCATKQYIVKFSNVHHSYQDNVRTYNAMKIAGHNQLAPHIIYASPEKNMIIMEYVHDDKRNNISNNKSFIAQLASQLCKLHYGKKFQNYKSIFDVARENYDIIADYKNEIIEKSFAELMAIEKSIQNKYPSKPCHNDLNPSNIMFNKNFIFLDWESACQGDPFFDIATISLFYTFNARQDKIFLKNYLNDCVSENDITRLYTMKKAAAIYYGILFVVMCKKRKLPILTAEQIAVLPQLQDYYRILGENLLKTDKSVQEFGLVLLNGALKNK